MTKKQNKKPVSQTQKAKIVSRKTGLSIRQSHRLIVEKDSRATDALSTPPSELQAQIVQSFITSAVQLHGLCERIQLARKAMIELWEMSERSGTFRDLQLCDENTKPLGEYWKAFDKMTGEAAIILFAAMALDKGRENASDES